MKANEISRIVEQMVPPALAYEGDAPRFVVGDPECEITSVGVTWRATVDVLREAKQAGIGMLIIHEPLLHSEKTFVVDPAKINWSPNKIRRSLLEETGLVVYRVHSNLDDSEPGQNTELAAQLGINIKSRLPYGRIGSITPVKFSQFVELVKKSLGCPYVLAIGKAEKEIRSVAVVAGGGNAMADMMELAKLEGADVMVSGDIQDSRARYAAELDLAIIDVGGYFTETPGMRAFTSRLQDRLAGIPTSYFDPGPPWSIL
jgi:dinuclear metal center YbgI/SA1388 family protein